MIIILIDRGFIELFRGSFGLRRGIVGDSRVFPNRWDAAPYGPYPYTDPTFS